jgi:hypothetical protein
MACIGVQNPCSEFAPCSHPNLDTGLFRLLVAGFEVWPDLKQCPDLRLNVPVPFELTI